MNSIVKKEQRNRALNSHWVRNAGVVFGAYPTNAPPTLNSVVGPRSRAPLFVSRVSNIAQNCPSLTVRNNRDRPTLSAHTSTKLDNCGVSTGDIHENPTTNIHHGGDIAA
jgi:hypothetical protein